MDIQIKPEVEEYILNGFDLFFQGVLIVLTIVLAPIWLPFYVIGWVAAKFWYKP